MGEKDWVYCNQDPNPVPRQPKFICPKCGGEILAADRVYRMLVIESTEGPNLGEVVEESQDERYGLAFECSHCAKGYDIEELEQMEEKVEGSHAPQKTTRDG